MNSRHFGSRTMINEFLWPELEDMDVDDVYLQQDGATCDTSGETIGFLREKFPSRVISRNGDYNWPPRSSCKRSRGGHMNNILFHY